MAAFRYCLERPRARSQQAINYLADIVDAEFRRRRVDGAFFPRNQTWETTFRASGSYRAPFGIVASSVFEYQSGAPLARTVLFRTGLKQLSTVTLRMEPLGAQRLPGVKLLNLR